MSESGSRQGWSQRFLSCLLAGALACTFVFPMMPRTAVADPLSDTSQEELIQQLLQGEYTEGRVLVSVSDNVAASSRNRSLSEGAALLSSAQDLMTVTPQEETPAPANGIAPLSLESDAPSETIKLIESDTLTTEQLIRALINEPGVTAVEPDYLIPIEDTPSTPLTSEDYAKLANATTNAASVTNETSNGQPDFTPLQWAYQPNGTASIHVPGWDDQADQNMTHEVYVAVIDDGVDYTHPDLKGAFAPLPHVNAAGVTGGDFGIDTWDRNDDPIDTESGHGTHCAGIIAGTWNDGGISGVASQAKLIAVRAGNARTMSWVSIVTGYAYLKELIEEGVPVRVVSNSWGGPIANTILIKAVAELEQYGVVSIFSAGNSGDDIAETALGTTYVSDLSSVMVGSSDEQGQPNMWSSYSTRFVDVFAPGSNILSTLPVAMKGYLGNKDAMYWEDFESYIPDPQATPAFIDEKRNPASVSISDEVYHTSGTSSAKGQSVAVDMDSIPPSSEQGDYKFCVISLPRDRVQGAVAASVQVAFVGENSDIDVELQVFEGGEWLVSSSLDFLPVPPGHEGEALWTELSVLFPEVDVLNPEETRTRMDLFVMLASNDGSPIEGTLYVDDLAFGSEDQLVPYIYESGTSMATPVIAGAAAVLMGQEQYSDRSAETAALVAATIAGSVTQESQYKDLCRSSGRFDFSCIDNPVPVVRTLSLEGNRLDIGGYFFGDKQGATVTLTPEGGDPLDVTAKVESWSDRSIVLSGVEVPPGQVTVTVTASRLSGEAQAFGRKTSLLVDDTTLYETDLTSTLPDDYEFNWFDGNTITGLGGKLYFLLLGEHNHDQVSFNVRVFDTKTASWSKVALPPTLAGRLCDNAQTVAYQGRLLVYTQVTEGEAMHLLHAFDPVTGQWQEYSLPEEIPLNASIGVLGDDLLFIGGSSIDDAGELVALASVLSYDLETGRVSTRGALSEARSLPAVRSDGTMMVVGKGVSYNKYGEQIPVETSEEFAAGEFAAGEFAAGTLPAASALSATSALPAASALSGGRASRFDLLDFTVAQSGMVLIASAKGEDPDTLMRPFGEFDFQPYPKRVSPVRMTLATCEAYEGKLYVLGFNDSTTPGETRVFRATEVATVHNPHTDLREPAKDPVEDPSKDPGKEPGKEPGKDPTGGPTDVVDLPANTQSNAKPPVATGDTPALPAAAVVALVGLAGTITAARRRRHNSTQ